MVKIGDKYGRLTVIGIARKRVKYKTRTRNLAYAVCICDCGKKVSARAEAVENGITKSCGCLVHDTLVKRNKEMAKTWLSHTRLYSIFVSMHDRCENKKHEAYKRYSENGITICEEWKDFEPFAKWALESGYGARMTLDRRDNTKGYSPDNCRWVSMTVQERNRSNTIYVDFEGKKQSLAELSERYGIERHVLWGRIRSGWDINDALFTPVTKANAHGLRPKIEVSVEKITDWMLSKDMALKTMNMNAVNPPNDVWKATVCRCEHSPLRCLQFIVMMKNISYSTSVHLVRHKFGVEHYIGTQRTDRTADGVERGDLPQNAPVNHTMMINAAEIIFISRRRLCNMASAETRRVWSMVVEQIRKIEPELAAACVPECIYRGFCPEFKSCGFCNTCTYKDKLAVYRDFKNRPRGEFSNAQI